MTVLAALVLANVAPVVVPERSARCWANWTELKELPSGGGGFLVRFTRQ